MEKITVRASGKYDILIAGGLLANLGAYAAKTVAGRKCVIVSDSNVAPLYMADARASLGSAGIDATEFIIPAGETSKNPANLVELLETAASSGLSRKDFFVALGGGVVGDLTALAASLYMRGIAVVAVPTTLLSAVDASGGGKTAVDLRGGKNLMGTFWQPSLVLCDTASFGTLDAKVFADGCAEVIKYAILYDKKFFAFLAKNGVRGSEEQVVSKCVAFKRDVVENDERDTGDRAFLNLGHTFAHAIELCSDYSVSHGSAVAVGLVMACRVAEYLKLCGHSVTEKVFDLVASMSLPCGTDIDPAELAAAALKDKKRSGDRIELILPREIGNCVRFGAKCSDLPLLFEVGTGRRI